MKDIPGQLNLSDGLHHGMVTGRALLVVGNIECSSKVTSLKKKKTSFTTF